MNFLSKISAGVQGFMNGFMGGDSTIVPNQDEQSGFNDSGWFTPGTPLPPMAPSGLQVRQMQYPAGYNLQTMPRAMEPVTFEQLRALADNYDLLRLAIETRKDQIEAIKWNITPINKKDKSQDANVKLVISQLRKPDRQRPWRRWLRMLVEEVLVTDAPAIYYRRTRGGGPYSLDLIDGATIKKNLDETGRVPEPPLPAYQQILYGIPAIDLTTDELLYLPRNERVNRVYGLGNVEQIIITVNLGIRRQLYQLGYYTEGNVPDTWVPCPPDWTVDQVGQFQAYWDAIFENNQNLRRKARFTPGGVTPIQIKENPMKDEFDEWLARVICYCFSLSPTAFVKETNRATAETVQEAAKAEGLAPLLGYVKELMDMIIQDYMGFTELEFSWAEEEIQDPLEQAQVYQIYVQNKVFTPDEVRAELGKDPLSEEQKAELNPPPPPQLDQADQGEDEPLGKPGDQALEKVEKADKTKKKELKPLSADTPQLKKFQQKLNKVVAKFLSDQADDIAEQVTAAYESIEKVDKKKLSIVDQILLELNFDNWSILFDDVEPILEEISQYGGYRALGQVGISDKDITKLVDQDAVEYAQKRAAELVGMKYVNGELVENPNPRWAITESTREYLRGTVSQAVDDGWSAQDLAKAVKGNAAFDAGRAEMIGRTELAFAHTNGNVVGWKSSGVVQGKQSILADDHDDSDVCADNAAAGVIPIDEAFPSGDDGPPYHPNCKCVVIPVVKEDKNED